MNNYNRNINRSKLPKQIIKDGIVGGDPKKYKALLFKKLQELIFNIVSKLEFQNFCSKDTYDKMQIAASYFYELIENYNVNLCTEYSILINANQFFIQKNYQNGYLLMKNLKEQFKLKTF